MYTAVFLKTKNNGWHEVTDDILDISRDKGIYVVTFQNHKKYNILLENLVQKNVVDRVTDNSVLAKLAQKEDTVQAYILDSTHYLALSNKKGPYVVFRPTIDNAIKEEKNIFYYYYSLAQKHDDCGGTEFLKNQYDFVTVSWGDKKNVLYSVLNGDNEQLSHVSNSIILPFSHNLSQLKAIENGLKYKVSVVQGPPGTGKTQTILNFICCAVYSGKTVAVISNNNKAIFNVEEKLNEQGYGFLCACLGNTENKEVFFSGKHDVPSFSGESYHYVNSLESLINQEREIFKLTTDIAEQKQKRDHLISEFEKFKLSGNNYEADVKFKNPNKISNPENIMNLAATLEKEGKEQLGFFKRIKYYFQYGISTDCLKHDIPELTASLRNMYVNNMISYLDKTILKSQDTLDRLKDTNLTENITKRSKMMLNAKLKERYSKAGEFEFDKNNFKHNFSRFIERYPVILSSTFCLNSCAPPGFLFDYIIIDEASQSTITTVLPALTKGKQLIVIGDDKQLPPVLNESILAAEKSYSVKYNTREEWRDNGKSFLAFVQKRMGSNLPVVMLREHYRCNPQIISFSNEYIYGSNLELMQENDGKNHLTLIKTVPGNHARKNDTGEPGLYNQREIDEIVKYVSENLTGKSIGVITPYRRQAELLREVLPKEVDVGTVHTFQGGERDIIIFSSVANTSEDYVMNDVSVKSFINNEQLINVAITRAKEQFVFVTSDKIFNSNYGILSNLVKYIKYQVSSVVKEGSIYSVFDLLYSDYNDQRKKLLNSNEIASEQIVEKLLIVILTDEKYSFYSFSEHVTLREVIDVDKTSFSIDEQKYLTNPWTHIDFVIYNKCNKVPVLALEIDGIKYHEQNEKQKGHDAIKDKALVLAKLPILRVKTNESGIHGKIVKELDEIINSSVNE